MAANRRLVTVVTLLMAVVRASGPLTAQEAPAPAGHWEGAILVPGGELGIDVDLRVQDGVWSGDISIPVQATQDFVLSEVMVEGSQVSFLMAGVPGDPAFKGTVSEDGQAITGTFTQGGQSLEFRLTRSDQGGGWLPAPPGGSGKAL
jgi:hypothetical protein